MGNEAWEKAVEAGADTWPRGPDFHLWIARKQTEAIIRAAFPILAEELAEVVECIDPDGPDIAERLRARIEQMKEQS